MKQNFYTKIFLLLIALWGVGGKAKGQLVYEPFNGTGNLSGYNGWTTHSGTANQLQRISGSLNYMGIPASMGNKVSIKAGDTEDLNKDIGADQTGDVYFSALINVVNTTNMTTTGDYFLHFGATTGTSVTVLAGRLHVRAVGASNFNLGILNQSGGTPVTTYLSTNFNVGTTYFVVVKYNTTSNTASLWVNPSLGGSEPAPDATNNTGTNTTAQVRSICIRQGGSGSNTTGNIEIDEIRVGTTWASVTPAAATPSLSVTPASLSGFTTTAGTPSTSQSYSLSGSNLSGSAITVTAPTNFEVSLDNSTFSSSVSVSYSGGTLSATTIYVRITSSASAGSVSGNVTHSGGGVTSPPSVAVSGTVNPATPFLSVSPASLSGFTTTAGTPSTSQNYSLSGGNLSPASGSITVTAPTNFEVSLNNTTFSSSVNVSYSGGTLSATPIYVRIATSAPVGTVSGNITHAGGGVTTPPSVAVSGNVSAPFSPVYEPFAGTGNLSGQNGWATHNGTANEIQRIAGNLNYPGLETGTGNKIRLLSSMSEDVNKGFSTITSGAVYASCVIRVSDVSKFQANSTTGTYFMHFADYQGSSFPTSAPFAQFVARLTIRQGSAPDTYQLGILNNTGGSPTSADIFGSSPQNLNINTNYFIVIKYVFATNTASLFINPVPGAPEPSPTHSSSFSTNTTPDIESICIRNSNSSGIGTGDIEIDELRVGITWAQVTPPNTSPVINVNPATLNVFTTTANTASAVQDYIVSASNLTSNLVITAPAGFEIKRSTDATYASSVTLVPTGGNVPNTTINVRLAASNTNAKILIANITNTSGTLTETVGVRGVVNAVLANFPDTPKDQVANPQTYTFSAVGLTENLVITNNDNQNYALSKDGSNFASSISFTPAEVNNNNVTISVRFQPKSNVNGLKPVNIEHSANSLTSVVSTEGRQLEPLSIADELAAQTIIFPNPASKYVQIQTNGMYQVVVQDVTGRKVAQCNSNEIINTEKLPNGLYFLQFSNENVKFVKRLIVQK
ncbi:MAG: T9SS type A sorting domain-containing protein [Raineya sp.]|nr:T9SS type A sorting domain-containing protein [Raineya sp.]